MKKTYKAPSITKVQVQSSETLLVTSLTGQQGQSTPSVTIGGGPFNGEAATKGESFWPTVFE